MAIVAYGISASACAATGASSRTRRAATNAGVASTTLRACRRRPALVDAGQRPSAFRQRSRPATSLPNVMRPTARASASVSVCMPLRKESCRPRRRRLRTSPAFARRLDLAPNDAAVLLLEGVNARKCGGHRDPLGISRVDAGDERIDRIFENLRAEPAAGEVGDRFLDVGGRRRDERLAPQAKLRAGSERRAHEAVRRAMLAAGRAVPSRTM